MMTRRTRSILILALNAGAILFVPVAVSWFWGAHAGIAFACAWIFAILLWPSERDDPLPGKRKKPSAAAHGASPAIPLDLTALLRAPRSDGKDNSQRDDARIP